MSNTEEIKEFIQERFNRNVNVLRQLPSFEDTNFLCGNESSKDELLVLKLLCERPYLSESALKRQLKSKLDCVHHLECKGFKCSVFLEGIDGNCVQELTLTGDGNSNQRLLALLYTYLPGKELEHTGYVHNATVVFQIGAFLGCYHKAFEDFHTDGNLIPEQDNPWHSSNYNLLAQDVYLGAAQDEATKEKLKSIMTYVSMELDSAKDILRKGILHGDFQGLNVIVAEDFDIESCALKFLPSSPASGLPGGNIDSCQESTQVHFPVHLLSDMRLIDPDEILRKFGLIDFEDISYSYLVLEVGRAIADAMVTLLATTSCADTFKDDSSNPFDLDMSRTEKTISSTAEIGCEMLESAMKDKCLRLGSWIICGYLSTNHLSATEYNVILPAVLTALCQYCILGVQAMQDNPSNSQYVGYCSKEALTLLDWMHAMKPQDVYQIWNATAHDFVVNLKPD